MRFVCREIKTLLITIMSSCSSGAPEGQNQETPNSLYQSFKDVPVDRVRCCDSVDRVEMCACPLHSHERPRGQSLRRGQSSWTMALFPPIRAEFCVALNKKIINNYFPS